jgi:hypothetical protein
MGDWYPRTREGQILLVERWLSILQRKGHGWGIPLTRIMDLTVALIEAKETLAEVKSGGRTVAGTAKCNEVFMEMELDARMIKRFYLLSPPLPRAALADLLPSAWAIVSPGERPVLTVTCPERGHILNVQAGFLPDVGRSEGRGSGGGRWYGLYRGVLPSEGTARAGSKYTLMRPPVSGNELYLYRLTRRRAEPVVFAASEAGMRAYFCARGEDGEGGAGEWGTVAEGVGP